MGKQTSLYPQHVQMGAKMVDFGGWDMPLHYGSQIEEHHAVRRDAGMFDVSHMPVVDLERRARARDSCATLLANDVGKLKAARQGALLVHAQRGRRHHRRPDRLLRATSSWFRMVVNAATARQGPGLDRPSCRDLRRRRCASARDLAMIAVQGPQAREQDCTPPCRRGAHARPSSSSRSAARERRRCVRRAHRLHRRGRLRDHAAGGPGRRTLWQSLSARGVSPAAASARATPCAWKRA